MACTLIRTVIVLVGLGLAKADPQCSTHRASRLQFSMKSEVNSNGHRLVTMDLKGDTHGTGLVGGFMDSWTELCDGTQIVVFKLNATVPTRIIELRPAVDTSPTEVITVESEGTELPVATSSTPVPPSICMAGYELLLGVGCFKVVNAVLTWEEARLSCEVEGARLAVPNSQEEMKFLMNITQRSALASWVGIRKVNSQWMTVEGEPIDIRSVTLQWYPGEPFGTGDCLHVTSAGLRDNKCYTTSRSICEQ